LRRLPVVDGAGRLIGIITDRDLREHAGHLGDTRVTGAMVEQVVTVAPDDAVDRVADLLLHHRIGGFPVVEPGGRLVGMITETDILRGLLLESKTRASFDVLCTAPTQTLAELVGVIESEGGAVVAMRREARYNGVRAYRLHLAQESSARFTTALREHGYRIREQDAEP
jgi:CBS domain-containing protein